MALLKYNLPDRECFIFVAHIYRKLQAYLPADSQRAEYVFLCYGQFRWKYLITQKQYLK